MLVASNNGHSPQNALEIINIHIPTYPLASMPNDNSLKHNLLKGWFNQYVNGTQKNVHSMLILRYKC